MVVLGARPHQHRNDLYSMQTLFPAIVITSVILLTNDSAQHK
jgi:hypothetical protein